LQRRTVYPQHYAHGRLALHFETHFETFTGERIDAFKQPLVSGTRGTWVLNVTNHEADLAAGAAIGLVRFDAQIAFDLQTHLPRGRDYCLLASESRAQLSLSAGRTSVNLLTVHIESGIFRKGETFTLRIGDRSHGGAGSEVFWSSTEAQFLLAVAQPGQELFEGVAGNPHSLHITHHPIAHLVRLLGPTVVAPGEPFFMHVGVFDRNRNLIEDYEGHVYFIPPEHVWRLHDAPDAPALAQTDALEPSPPSARYWPLGFFLPSGHVDGPRKTRLDLAALSRCLRRNG
jgi:hypothetical protein